MYFAVVYLLAGSQWATIWDRHIPKYLDEMEILGNVLEKFPE